MPPGASGGSKVTDFLPEVTVNKKYIKREKLRRKQAALAAERELGPGQRRKLQEKRAQEQQAKELAALRAAKVALSKKSKKKSKSSTEKKQTGTVSKVTSVNSKKGFKKGEAPKLTVGGLKTGKETLLKKKARELVLAKKKEKREALASAKKVKKGKGNRRVSFTESEPTSDAQADGELDTVGHRKRRPRDGNREEQDAVAVAAAAADEPAVPAEESEEEILARAIRGAADGAVDWGDSAVDAAPSFLPQTLPFADAFEGSATGEAVEEGTLLQQADAYFGDLARREKELYRQASAHLRHMKQVNARGGDKDGFRYVLPNDVKSIVRQMLAQEQRAAAGDGAEVTPYVDPEMLSSTFGGDPVKETEQRPVRRKKARYDTLSDFYQFQISKKWTRNAERFLKRGRVNKSMFEAKKHQRSIRKL